MYKGHASESTSSCADNHSIVSVLMANFNFNVNILELLGNTALFVIKKKGLEKPRMHCSVFGLLGLSGIAESPG